MDKDLIHTLRQRMTRLLTASFTPDFVKIGDNFYLEDAAIEYDGEDYVLLRNTNDPSDVQIRRVYEYFEAVEDETKLRGALSEFETKEQLEWKVLKRSWWAFDIVIYVLTVAVIVGNSWFITHCGTTIFAHEMVCYALLGLSFCAINHHYLSEKDSLSKVSITVFGLATAFTFFVFLLNNWWHYLYENTRFFWNLPDGWYWSYSAALKSDIRYNIGIGKFRYLLVFLASGIGLAFDTFFARSRLSLRLRWSDLKNG